MRVARALESVETRRERRIAAYENRTDDALFGEHGRIIETSSAREKRFELLMP
jgi:hypothetical protein